jgi:hypothetical protein
MSTGQSGVSRAPRPSSLADVLDLILDKGLVVDAYVRVSVVGIELLTIDARIVIASVDTYLHFAEAVNRLDLRPTETEGVSGLLGHGDSDDSKRSGPQQPNGRTKAVGRRLGVTNGNTRDEEDEKADHSGSGRGSLVGRLANRGKWEET